MTISNCGHDENNRYNSGKAGDQTGTEWYVRSWYNGGWTHVFRHPNAKTRALIAEMAKAAANNNNIGYDQYERLTFWNQLEKVKYHPENISTKCEADCSSGVAAIVKGAGYRLGDTKMQGVNPSVYTGNQEAALKSAGFQVLRESKYLTSDAYLLEGDILMSGGHTCTNLTNGSKSSITSTVASTIASIGKNYDSTPDDVTEIQTYMNRHYSSGLEEDGIAGPLTKKTIVKEIQRLIGTSPDGIFGPNSKKAWGSRCVQKGSVGALVRLVQMMLVCRGYSVGSAGCDGDCGTQTVNAIKKYQGANGLEKDGCCGPLTIAKLLA